MKSSLKPTIIKISIAFILIVALMTYFSGQIDNYLLPHVTKTLGSDGTLKYHLHTDTVVERPPASKAYALPIDFPVGDIAVREGSSVSKGERLLQYDAQEYAATKKTLGENVERLESEQEKLYTEYTTAKDKLSAQSAMDALQETHAALEAAQETYDNFVSRFDSEGWLLAGKDMEIASVSAGIGATVPEGTALFYYAADPSALQIRFTCDPALGELIFTNSKITIRVPLRSDEGEPVYRKGSAVIIEKKSTQNGVECTAEIKDVKLEDGETMPTYGDPVIIETEFESRQYAHIVMKSAIHDESYVYVITKNPDEKRYVYQVPVSIIAENEFYAAVDMTAESLPLVLTSSKALEDGQRVIVDD